MIRLTIGTNTEKTSVIVQPTDTLADVLANNNVNTASSAILGYIAGLNKAIAQQIVEYRKEHGRFEARNALKNVPVIDAPPTILYKSLSFIFVIYYI